MGCRDCTFRIYHRNSSVELEADKNFNSSPSIVLYYIPWLADLSFKCCAKWTRFNQTRSPLHFSMCFLERGEQTYHTAIVLLRGVARTGLMSLLKPPTKILANNGNFEGKAIEGLTNNESGFNCRITDIDPLYPN